MARLRCVFLLILGGCLAFLASPSLATESALDRLRALAPAVAARLDPVSRAVLSRISTDDLQSLAAGATASELHLGDGRTLAEFVQALFGGSGLAVPFSTIDSGGGLSSAGNLALLGTIGQSDAHLAENIGAGLLLVGGFRGRGAQSPNVLFIDGFETGSYERWSSHTLTP